MPTTVPAMQDYVFNGSGYGEVADRLAENNWDVGLLRPYKEVDGNSYVSMTVNKEGKFQQVVKRLTVNNATLLKDEWIEMDSVVLQAAKPPLQIVQDLRGAGLQYIIPNGMSKTVLQYQTASDVGPATVSMSPVREGENDRVEVDLRSLPLPIIHKDFHYDMRELSQMRASRMRLDLSHAEQAARRVAEEAEKLHIGISGSFSYGGNALYGMVNDPQRITYGDLMHYNNDNWTPAKFIENLLAMKRLSQDKFHYGPWKVYVSTDWDTVLDDDYSATKGSDTLRDRAKRISGIKDVVTSDYLPAGTVIMVQLTSNVIRTVVGMDINTMQWESKGGLLKHFKIMAILVPQIRSDHYGNTGIIHAVAADPDEE